MTHRIATLILASIFMSALVATQAGAAVPGAMPPGGTFADDNGNIHEGSVEAIAAAGITRGCNPPANTLFCPSPTVTRGQMAAFLTRALGLSRRANDPFSDDDNSIYEADIERLAAAGITKGCNPPENDRYCPEANVTRGQMAAFLVRAFGYTDAGAGDVFTDDDGSVYEADIDRLGTSGVTLGCNPPTNDRYCPDSPVLRDQMASFLSRALDLTPIYPLLPIVGTWEGLATTPAPWGTIGHVMFDFRTDGTYTADSASDVGALYWGTEGTSPLRTYEFWGPSPGGGKIAVLWIYDGKVTSMQWGRLANVATHGDQLRFELWNDWGARPPYGPVKYALTRTG